MLSKFNINIIFEDENILVICKPAGLLSIPDRYDKDAPNLRHILTKKYGEIFVIHRLDRETSGVMVFAKNAESHRNINQQFEDLKVKKLYHVVVSGQLPKDEIEVDIPLIPDPGKPGRMLPYAGGKESLTIIKVVERFRQATLAECNLVTGRHHQIRAHCAAIGYPLLVDEFYGNLNEFLLSSIKRRFNLKKHDVERPIISRVTMHAHSIAFSHPVSNEQVLFEAPYPKDFQALLQVLRKYSSFSTISNIFNIS